MRGKYTYSKSMKEGQKWLNLYNYKEAAKAFVKALELNPERPDALVGIGNIYLYSEIYGGALFNYDKALKLDRNYSDAWTGIGYALLHLNKRNEAKNAFARAWVLENLSLDKQIRKGIDFYGQKNYDDALEIFDVATNKESNIKRIERGLEVLRVDITRGYITREYEIEKTARKFEVSVDDVTKESSIKRIAEAWNNKGLVFLQQGRYKEALTAFNESTSRSSDTEGKAGARNNKGLVFLQQGRYKEALTVFEECTFEIPKNAGFWNNKGLVHYESGSYEEAIKAFSKALSIEKNDVNALNNKALVYLDQEKYNESLDVFEQALETFSKNSMLWNNKGLVLYEQKKYNESVNSLQRAKEICPKSAVIHNNLATVFLKLGNSKCAKKNLEYIKKHESNDDIFASKADETDIIALNLKGQINVYEKNYKDAVSCFDKAMSLCPVNPSTVLWRAYAKALKIELLNKPKESRETSKFCEEIYSTILELDNLNAGLEQMILSLSKKQSRPSIEQKSDFNRRNNFCLIGSIYNPISVATYSHTLKPAKKYKNLNNYVQMRAFTLYFLGCLLYKLENFLMAKEKLKMCIKMNTKSEYDTNARELLNHIWDNKIRPFWIRWWLSSPINSLVKRVLFIVLNIPLVYLFGLALKDPFSLIIHEMSNTYIFCIIVVLLILISPNIKSIKFRDIEIEFYQPPPQLNPLIARTGVYIYSPQPGK